MSKPNQPDDESVCALCRNISVNDTIIHCTQCELPVHVGCAGETENFLCIACQKVKKPIHCKGYPRKRVRFNEAEKVRHAEHMLTEQMLKAHKGFISSFRRTFPAGLPRGVLGDPDQEMVRLETPRLMKAPGIAPGAAQLVIMVDSDSEAEEFVPPPPASFELTESDYEDDFQEEKAEAAGLLMHLSERAVEEFVTEIQEQVEAPPSEKKHELMFEVLSRCQKASFVNPFIEDFGFEYPAESVADVLHWGLVEFSKLSDDAFSWQNLPYKPEMVSILQAHVPSILFMAGLDAANVLLERYFIGGELRTNAAELAEVTFLNPRVIRQFPNDRLHSTLFALIKLKVEVRDIPEVEACFGYS